MKYFANAKRLASLLLLAALFLPLSQCTRKSDPDSAKVIPDTVHYGIDMMFNSLEGLGWQDMSGLWSFLALALTFVLPACLMLVRGKWQPALLLAATVPAVYFLSQWLFVFASKPLIGGWLALACWLVLFFASLAELWRWAKPVAPARPA